MMVGGGGLSKNVSHHDWLTKKKNKLKRPKAVPKKRNLDFLRNRERCQFFHMFQWASSECFLISDFLTEILKAKKSWQKR